MIKNYNYKLIGKYRTALMGIAMLLVVIYHATIDLSLVPIISTIEEINIGGVDIFLMLSGSGLYFAYQKYKNASDFYKRRLLRIIPIYLPIVFIFCTLLLIAGKISFGDLVLNLTTLSFWLNIKNRFDWYIPSIMVLYLITPLFLYFFNRKNKIITMAIGICCPILFSVLISASAMQYLLIFTTRIPIFLIGILVGYLISVERECSKVSLLFYIISLILGLIILYMVFAYFKDYIWSYGICWYPFILITLPLCIIVTIFLQYVSKFKTIKLTFLTFCGTHSLEIYLFHERILYFSNHISRYLSFDKYRLVVNLICFILTLSLAYICRKIIVKFLYIFNKKNDEFKHKMIQEPIIRTVK